MFLMSVSSLMVFQHAVQEREDQYVLELLNRYNNKDEWTSSVIQTTQPLVHQTSLSEQSIAITKSSHVQMPQYNPYVTNNIPTGNINRFQPALPQHQQQQEFYNSYDILMTPQTCGNMDSEIAHHEQEQEQSSHENDPLYPSTAGHGASPAKHSSLWDSSVDDTDTLPSLTWSLRMQKFFVYMMVHFKLLREVN